MSSKSSPVSPATIRDIETKVEVTCSFRPKELTMSKQNSWSATPSKGHNVGKLDFGGGGNAKLQVELLFDSSSNGSDIRDETSKLWNMMLVTDSTRGRGTNQARPPWVQFTWGRMNSFVGAIESLNQKFILFKSDGTPVRAIVHLSMTQFAEDQGDTWVPQNPTSAGIGGQKTRVVEDGEMLDLIAFEEYGSASRWRKLAEVNKIRDPLRLEAGTVLAIPPLSQGWE
jgi:hypothetical protein